MRSSRYPLVVALVLVGVPLGVFLGFRTHHPRPTSDVRRTILRLERTLRRQGYADVSCGFTGYTGERPSVISCQGSRDDGHNRSSFEEIEVQVGSGR